MTRRELESQFVAKAWKDASFRKEVTADPKAAFEKYTGRKLPEQVRIFIHEEDPNTVHFSLPPAPTNVSELSDDELQRVAGGTELVLAIPMSIALGLITGSLIGTAVANDKLW